MNVDVFLCSCARDAIRQGLFAAVYARWGEERGINLKLVTPEVVKCSLLHFQGARRLWAEERSESDIYILAEDDCLPLGRNFVERGMKVMERHPEFATLSPMLLPFPPQFTPLDDEVATGITSGGINFTRRGLIDKAVINSRLPWDECAQAEHLKEKGHLVGWMRNVKCNHTGATLSTLWPEPYTGVTSVNDA